MKIYFDQNSWHKIFESYTAKKFKEIILSRNIEIYFGIENLYEFGRLFLEDTQHEKIKYIFSYLWELSEIMHYLKEPNELIVDDLEYAIHGGKIFPFLDQFDTTSTKQEIYKISQGDYTKGRTFIANREKNIKKDSPEFCKAVKSINPKSKQSIKYGI